MQPRIFPTNEIPSERGNNKVCEVCLKEFGVFKKQHQCKRCLRAVCSQCGDTKREIYKQGMVTRMHRICKMCKLDSDYVIECIGTNRLVFGRMSEVGSKWMKKVAKMPSNQRLDDAKHKKFTREVYNQIWDSYNYSLRQFIGLLIFKADPDETFRTVADVFSIVISAVPEEKIQHIVYLTIFMLCFCSPDKATILVLYLLELKASIRDGLKLVEAYLRALNVPQAQMAKMGDYIRTKAETFCGSFSINHLTVESTLYIISKIIQRRKIEELFVFQALLVDLNNESLAQAKGPKSGSHRDSLLLRNCSIGAVTKKYRQAVSVKVHLFQKENDGNTRDMQVTSESSMQNSLSETSLRSSLAETSMRSSVTDTSSSDSLDKPSKQGENDIRSQKESLDSRGSVRLNFRKKTTEIDQEDSFSRENFSMISLIGEASEQKNSGEDPMITNGSMFITGFIALANISNEPSLFEEIDKERNDAPIRTIEKDHALLDECKGIKKTTSTAEASAVCLNCQTLSSKLQDMQEKYKRQQQQHRQQYQEHRQQHQQHRQQYQQHRQQQYQQQLQQQSQLLVQANCKLQKQVIRIQELQGIQRSAQASQEQVVSLRKLLKKSQSEQSVCKQQLEELQLTNKMLKNKLESMQILPDSRHKERLQETERINEMLKNSLLEKNQQIEALLKKNKLLAYQIEEINRQKEDDSNKNALRIEIDQYKQEKEDLLGKMNQLSELLMLQEEEKIILSEENFELRESLRSNGIRIVSKDLGGD